MCHPMLSDSIQLCFVWRQALVCIWQCHPVMGGANQFVGKIVGKPQANQAVLSGLARQESG